MKYLLIFLLSPLVLFSMNQSEQPTNASKQLANAKETSNTLCDFLISNLKPLMVSNSNFIDKKHVTFLYSGIEEIKGFLDTGNFEHLAEAQLCFENASQPFIEVQSTWSKEKGFVGKEKLIYFPLAQYACAVTSNVNDNQELAFEKLKKCLETKHLLSPLSIKVPEELLDLAYIKNYEPAKHYLQTHRSVIRKLQKEKEKIEERKKKKLLSS